jgi:hypothetical protein
MPGPLETMFLKACLHSGNSARGSFGSWWRQAGGSREALRRPGWGDHRLLPLLFDSARRNALEVDRELRSVVRTAYAREELRGDTYRAACRDVLDCLGEAGVRTIVLPGAALAEHVYGDWALRHCSDLDLLVTDDDLEPAAEALAADAAAGESRRVPDGARLSHASGMPVALHTRLFRQRYYRSLGGPIGARSHDARIAGAAASVPDPALSLVYVLAQAGGTSGSLVWVADAWYLVQRTPDLDWDLVRSSAQRGRTSLIAFVLLDWLRRELELDCDESALAALRDDASRAERGATDAALIDAVGAGPGRPRELLRATPGWSDRLRVLSRALLPSAEYMRAQDPAAPLALAYPRRIARYAWGRARPGQMMRSSRSTSP